MEQNTESHQDLSTKPTTKSRLLLSSLGITFLTISLYLLLSWSTEWLPEAYKDNLLDWAGPWKDLPPEGVWLVQGTIISILACGLGLLLLHGLVKLFSGRKLYLSFGRITEKQRRLLAKNTVIYFIIIIAQTVLFSLLDLGRFIEESEIQTVPTGLWGNFLTFFFVTAAAPIFEEALFRGFLYARLRSVFKFWPAFLVSGLFFSLLHSDLQLSTISNIFIVFDSLIFSYFVTKIFEETGNLWTSIIFHAIYNGWLTFVLVFVSVVESLLIFP